jgi:hypothetical protein
MSGVLIALVLVACLWNLPLASRSHDESARLHGERTLAAVEPGALIFGWWETVPLVEYLQLVEGRRPDVQAINRFLISQDDLLALIAREAPRRPVYLDNPTAEMLRTLRVEQVGPLYRLTPREPTQSTGAKAPQEWAESMVPEQGVGQ